MRRVLEVSFELKGCFLTAILRWSPRQPVESAAELFLRTVEQRRKIELLDDVEQRELVLHDTCLFCSSHFCDEVTLPYHVDFISQMTPSVKRENEIIAPGCPRLLRAYEATDRSC